MDNIKTIINSLLAYTSEEDWFEFKDSWYDAVGIDIQNGNPNYLMC